MIKDIDARIRTLGQQKMGLLAVIKDRENTIDAARADLGTAQIRLDKTQGALDVLADLQKEQAGAPTAVSEIVPTKPEEEVEESFTAGEDVVPEDDGPPEDEE